MMQPVQQQVPASEPETNAVPAAPANWMDIVRQHVTGPVFSLAFHIILLVILGTLVFIAPNAVKDDIEPVQITEMEPVLPPPEEEPMPSDMTVMDTSSPSLDRYESDNQQMEEVGVTDVEIMTDIDISTPLTIPDNNSALKLHGVLPFGRPGGGNMGDGGDGDGRGNLKGMLQGVFYDLKQTRNRQPTEFMGNPNSSYDPGSRRGILPVIKNFVHGSWRREYDNNGNVHYPALDQYYCSPTRLWSSCFYSEEIDATRAPRDFQCSDQVKTSGGWVCIYSGNVVAPFSGKFRFLGTADDVILVRFNKQIVLDYGWYSFTMGIHFTDNEFNGNGSNFRSVFGGSPQNDFQRRTIAESELYSKNKLSVYYPEYNRNHGLAKGAVIEVNEGQVYPIEIIISEVPGGEFLMMLFMEQLDDNGNPIEPNPSPDRFTLFRTTLDLPDLSKNTKRDTPRFNPYGPIWRVVRSTASAGGSGSGSLLGNRTSPRTARVNEDDDDLSL